MSYIPPWIHPLGGPTAKYVPPYVHPLGAPAAAPAPAKDKGGTAIPAASTAAAPAPVSAPPVPPPSTSYQDSTYNATLGNIHQGLDNLRGYLSNQGKQLGLNYGINYQGDPITGASGFSIDPNVDVTNPFSQAALAKKTFDQQATGNTNSYATRGQLYSGALQNAQNQTGFARQQSNDALLKDFSSQFGGLYQQWLAAQQQASGQEIDAQSAALARHENDPAPGTGSAVSPEVAGTAAVAGTPLTPTGAPAPKPPAGLTLAPGVMYLPPQGGQAQIVNPDGTVRPATAADKGGTAAPAPPPPPKPKDKGGTAG